MICVESTKTVLGLATLDDKELIVDLFQAYLLDVDDFGHDVLPRKENAERYWQAVFAPAIRDNRNCILLAERDKHAVGALFWVIPEIGGMAMRGTFAIDHGVWVASDFRREGLATEMRNHAKMILLHLGVNAVVSTILKDNVAGLDSYKKVGGKITGYTVEIPIMKGEV